MPSDARPAPSWVPPHTDPFVDAPLGDAAASPRPDAVATTEDMARRARALFDDAPGDAAPGDAAPETTTGTAHGLVSLQADQTHYSEGFALYVGMRHSCAVALRPADAPRLTTADGTTVPLTPDADLPPWAAALQSVVAACTPSTAPHWHVAVTSALPAVCGDSTAAALLVALLRALSEQPAAGPLPSLPALADHVGAAYSRPYSTAPVIAAATAAPGRVVLVDTATHEHLAVPTEAADAIAWVVLGAADPPLRPPSFYRQRKEQADTALTHLRAHGFPALQAFRDLAHRDLERARRALPEALQPIARHLVTENRRVQRHVAVLRRGDWQMVGGLLRMSHASLRTHWGSTPPIADALAAATESPAMDGLYGACMTERDGAVLVVGRPGTLADDVPRLHEVVAAQHGRPLRVLRPV